MYIHESLGTVPDGINYTVGNRGKVVEKPSVNPCTDLNRYAESVLRSIGESIPQIEFAKMMYTDETFNPWKVRPETCVKGIGNRRFNVEDTRKGIQAVQTHFQRLVKSGKADWIVRVESDGSLSDDKGNCPNYIHRDNLNGIDDLGDILSQIKDASELLG